MAPQHLSPRSASLPLRNEVGRQLHIAGLVRIDGQNGHRHVAREVRELLHHLRQVPSKKTNNGAFCRCFLEISGNVWECLEIDFGGIWRLFVFGRCFYGTKHDSAGMVGLEIVFGECDFQKFWEAAWCLGVLTDLLVQHCMFRDFSLKHARILQCHESQPESARITQLAVRAWGC